MLSLDAKRTGPAAPPHPYLETTTLIQRANRRLLEVVEDALRRTGCAEINAVQAILIYNIGDKELTAGELGGRDHYLGTNVSHSIKKLNRLGIIDHRRSEDDARVVHIKLTDKGQEVRDIIVALYGKHMRTVEQLGGVSAEQFAALNRTLMRLERFWGDQILYRL